MSQEGHCARYPPDVTVNDLNGSSIYEIYGTNKEGKKVEIYFNPVDGSIVKEKIK